MKSGFSIKKRAVTNGGFTYSTYQLSGWLNGRRIRKQFKDRAEAEGEKQTFEIQAANTDGTIRPVNTRLTSQQVAEAEAAFARLGVKSLSLAVEWFLESYRPPVTETTLDVAGAAFLSDRAKHVRARQLRDYCNAVKALRAAFPKRAVHTVTTAEVLEFLTARNVGKKRWNNLRGDLHAFFAFCALAPREWIRANPVTPITTFKISRGVPEVLSVSTVKNLMAFLEKFTGGPRSNQPPGFLVPYFTLCLFAGLRPSIDDGEVRKLADSPDPSKFIKIDLGVIQITPDISKVRAVRQVKIRPNLAAWMVRYPLKKYPIIVPNMNRIVPQIRKKFGLTDDVLRHTFISMHVSAWKSMGEAALEAGNSEAMIKKHYLNLITEADAAEFWGIAPGVKGEGDIIDLPAITLAS